MTHSRRDFLQYTAAGLASASLARPNIPFTQARHGRSRIYRFTQIDVFTAKKMEGNQLAVFPDARGLTDDEMQAIARETNLQETTFVFPRDPSIEGKQGIKVRIFIPQQENPFGGHPTLGTAMVLRNRRVATGESSASVSEISLELKVGKIPVAFSTDRAGFAFGEMRQIDPVFGQLHERAQVAEAIGVKPEDISEAAPIQTISTGLPFTIVPLKSLSVLQALRPEQQKIEKYFERRKESSDFYYVTHDAQDPAVGLRSRAIFETGEDPATGSAAGCTAAWMVRYGMAKPGETVRIQQGLEMKRPSQIYVRAEKTDDKVTNVRVGGNAVEVMQGEYEL